jgi:CHAD domain-containing protein
VTFRHLGGSLEQFAPALVLPEVADPDRVARINRRLGAARDLDVLRQRLESHLLPPLPASEAQQLRPLFKQLRRERRVAFEDLRACLQGRRYLKLLAKLQQWLKQPRFTALGEQPLEDWRPELLQAVLQGLFSQPGWWATNPYDADASAALHRLRRRIKRARYGLSDLRVLDACRIEPWVERFRELQQTLGELNDLQLIADALDQQWDGEPDQLLPGLCSLLAEQRAQAWERWQAQSQELREPQGRAALHRLAFDA